MQVVAALERLGGVGSTRQVVALSSRRRLREAIRAGDVRRCRRGLYALASVQDHRHRAHELAAVTSHLSAAAQWGWKVKWPPDRPWVTVPRNRKVAAATRVEVNLTYADLTDDEVVDGVTSPVRTVVDCARKLPFDEALAVADSALRSGMVSHEELLLVADALRGRGASDARRVARLASPQAANPFESALRALVLGFPALSVRPQAEVVARGMVFHPDLVDVQRRIVIEADSFEFHTSQEAHARDCVRYTALTVEGWLVLRFTWHQVMHSPAYVRGVLADAVARTDRRAKPPDGWLDSA